jgi:DNA-binding response OmpR family regulator
MLLVDVSIPGNNGCVLATLALARNPQVKVLMMSATAGAEVCKFYGFLPDDPRFLAKPFREEDLVARVALLMRGSNADGKVAGAGS